MRDFAHSIQALIALIFGTGDYTTMEKTNGFLAPLFYTMHLIIAGILFVNLLIAILTRQYEVTEKEAAKEWRQEIVYGGLKFDENKNEEKFNKRNDDVIGAEEEPESDENLRSLHNKLQDIMLAVNDLQRVANNQKSNATLKL